MFPWATRWRFGLFVIVVVVKVEPPCALGRLGVRAEGGPGDGGAVAIQPCDVGLGIMMRSNAIPVVQISSVEAATVARREVTAFLPGGIFAIGVIAVHDNELFGRAVLQPCDDSRDAHAVRRRRNAVLGAAVVPIGHVVVFALAGIAAESIRVLLQGAVPRFVHGFLNGGAVVHVQRDSGFASGDDMEPTETSRDVGCRTGGRLEEVRNETAAIIAHVESEACADLFQIVCATDGLCFLTRFGERRQQHGREDGYDGDHNQQLNQCKPFLLFHFDLMLIGLYLNGNLFYH